MNQILMSHLPFTPYPYRGESIDCNLCGSSLRTPISDKDRRWKNLKTVACSECGLMRTDPMPTEAELENYYRNEYRLDYQLAGKDPPKFHRVRSMRDARNRLKRLEQALVPGARVLDLGCGTGEFLHLASERGCDVIGIEPGKAYAEFARKSYGLDVINSPWQAAQLPAESFDLVTCNQVIEHLRDPMDALKAISGWLKPQGLAFIAVPDMRANDKPSFERFHFAHIYGFTPDTLEVATRLNSLVPAETDRLVSTTALFRKDPEYDTSGVRVRDPERAVRLAQTYPKDSVSGYLLGGGYFRHAGHRFSKWRRDTFIRQAEIKG